MMKLPIIFAFQMVHFFCFTQIQKIDVMGKLIDDLIGKTQEFLQPNPGMLQLRLYIYSKQLS